MLSVSIVIPVYNEAAYLAACLEAIAKQTIKPIEVIVVDNNSSDETMEIAKRYDFVRLLREPRQGVVYARDRGFDAATGDIIGRIDADSIIRADWIETVQRILSDPAVDAVSGSVRFYQLPFAAAFNKIDLVSRRHFAKATGRDVVLHGANMALRRSVWDKVRGLVCHVAGIHEDFDLAIHINRVGHRVIFDESLVASIAYRRADSNFMEYARYMFLSPRTYAAHNVKKRRPMYLLVWLSLAFYLPAKLLRRGYDVDTNKLSLRKFMRPAETSRVNPATFVDK